MSEIIQIGTTFHCFLILGEDGAVLVDTGLLPARNAIYEKIKDAPLRLIVLTHGHVDHIANAAYFSKKFNVPVAMHSEDAELITHPAARPLLTDNLAGMMLTAMSGMMSKSSPVEPFIPAFNLKEGMSLAQYGVDAEIVELPGHTAGSIGVLVNGNTLIAGDALMNMLGSPKPKVFEDKKRMLDTIARIKNMKLSSILMGHGKRIEK